MGEFGGKKMRQNTVMLLLGCLSLGYVAPIGIYLVPVLTSSG